MNPVDLILFSCKEKCTVTDSSYFRLSKSHLPVHDPFFVHKIIPLASDVCEQMLQEICVDCKDRPAETAGWKAAKSFC